MKIHIVKNESKTWEAVYLDNKLLTVFRCLNSQAWFYLGKIAHQRDKDFKYEDVVFLTVSDDFKKEDGDMPTFYCDVLKKIREQKLLEFIN